MRWLAALAAAVGGWLYWRRRPVVEDIGEYAAGFVEEGDDFTVENWCEEHGFYGLAQGTLYVLDDRGVYSEWWQGCDCESADLAE